jgi:hypothetical protein
VGSIQQHSLTNASELANWPTVMKQVQEHVQRSPPDHLCMIHTAIMINTMSAPRTAAMHMTRVCLSSCCAAVSQARPKKDGAHAPSPTPTSMGATGQQLQLLASSSSNETAQW